MLDRIWKKFTLALLAVAFIPIGYFGYQDFKAAKNSVIDEGLRDIFLNSVARSKDIERVFMNARRDINYLRSDILIQFLLDIPSEKPDAAIYWRSLVEMEFKRFLTLKPEYSRVGFLDEYGDEAVVVFKSGGEIKAVDDGDKRNHLTSSYYVKAAQLDDMDVAAIPMRSAVDPSMDLRGVTLVRYATKVFDRYGNPRGVIYVDLNGLEVLFYLQRISFEHRRRAHLVTGDGNYIFNPRWSSKPEDSFGGRQSITNISQEFTDDVVAQILSGRPGVITDDPKRLIGFSPVYPQKNSEDFFYVVFDTYSRDLFAPKVKELAKTYAYGALGALILVVAVAVSLSWALTRNVAKLREGAESIRDNRLGHRLEINSGDEMESLAKTFNAMADSIQEYQESLERKVEDRTRRVQQVERQLMQSEKLAAIGFLAAGVAHEINNPISIITTRLELISKALDKGKVDVVKKDLEVLRSHATRIGKIAASLLTFSRESSSELEDVDINEAVRRVMGLVGIPIRKKGIELDISLAPHLPPVRASYSGMEQVIYNIAYNAHQATAPGGRISIKTFAVDDGHVGLTISDTGEGIPKDVIKRVFEPFFTTKEVGEGTGLGLSISYGLINDFGGSIRVDSEPGAGAVFTIILDSARRGSGRRQGNLANISV